MRPKDDLLALASEVVVFGVGVGSLMMILIGMVSGQGWG